LVLATFAVMFTTPVVYGLAFGRPPLNYLCRRETASAAVDLSWNRACVGITQKPRERKRCQKVRRFDKWSGMELDGRGKLEMHEKYHADGEVTTHKN
jgi:hypothetical protein